MGKKKKLEIKEDLRQEYQAWKVLAVAGYVNDSEEKVARDLIEKIALEMNFIPSYFATIILTEGLGYAFLGSDYNFNITKNEDGTETKTLITERHMNGFMLAGTDDFGSEYSRYQKYLPSDFNVGSSEAELDTGAEFAVITEENEWGKETLSAKFNNLESMIYGFGATLSHRRDLFKQHAKELGHTQISEDELAYWTYMYYQGEGRARRVLSAAKSLDIYGRNGCWPDDCNVTAENRDPNDVSLSNLASWRYLQTFNLFSE